MEDNYNESFAKGIPSIIVVSSPFQAMCGIAAIRQLQINDYLFIAHCLKGNLRNEQIIKFLDSQAIKYKVYYSNYISSIFYRFKSYIHRKRGYKRLLIGNHYDGGGLLYAYSYMEDGAKVVYLDDGSQSISLFQNLLKERWPVKLKNQIENISSRRNFEIMKNFLSIYYDIPNNNYLIHKLDLTCFSKREKCTERSGVFIVGNVIREMCNQYQIDENELKGYLNEVLLMLSKDYPKEKIVYIPHGRDDCSWVPELCEKHDCEFRKINTMIEDELTSYSTYPKLILGFSSTALYTLKQLLPETRVINYIFNPRVRSDIYQEIEGVAAYYNKHDIEIVVKNLDI